MHCVGRKHRDEFQDSSDSDDENGQRRDAEAGVPADVTRKTGGRRSEGSVRSNNINDRGEADRVDAVNKLVRFADVDMLARDAKGRTALHLAARVGSIKTLKALLHNGHDVRVVDKSGNQAIQRRVRAVQCPPSRPW